MSVRANRASSHPPIPQTPNRPNHSRESSVGWSFRTFSPISLRTIDSSSFWRTPPKPVIGWKVRRWQVWRDRISSPATCRLSNNCMHQAQRLLNGITSSRGRIILWMCVLLIVVGVFSVCMPYSRQHLAEFDAYQPLTPKLQPSDVRKTDPTRWLRENSNDRHAIQASTFSHFKNTVYDRRPRAAIISLVRNTELEGMMQSMRQLEYRWNHKYQVESSAIC